MSQEEVETNVDLNGGSSTGSTSTILRDSDNTNPKNDSQAKQVPKKGKKQQPNPARSAAAKKAAAARKAKEDRLAQLEERISFFDNLYQQAEAEVGAAGAQEPEEQEEQAEPARPGDPGYHPGVGDVETTEEILDSSAHSGDMDDSGGGFSAPVTPQRRRVTGRRSGGAFNRRLYDKLDAAQGVVMSARGKVPARKRIGSFYTKVHRGMSEEELARFAIGSIRQNQYA